MGVPVDCMTTETALESAMDMMTSHHRRHVITLNSLMLLECEKNPELRDACLKADLLLPDSSGINLGLMSKYGLKTARIPGVDFAFDLIDLAQKNGVGVYLFGGERGVSAKAARFLENHYPRVFISGTRSGFFSPDEENHIIKDMAKSSARLILVALGMPRQEIWIRKNWMKLPPGLYVGVGGTLDVWAGKVSRAPAIFQKSGLEWLYRASQEPHRLGRISKLPGFALRALTGRL